MAEYQPIWPKDHPGRTCAKCGRVIYWLWVDAVFPPPGTCQDKAEHPRACETFKAHCITQLSLCRLMDKAPHPDFLKTLERAGVALDEAIVWRDNFQARRDAEDAAMLASLQPQI